VVHAESIVDGTPVLPCERRSDGSRVLPLSYGERLVVAINDDDSVRRLKGPGRPINPVERRMAVLAGLEAVDWVVSFSEDTPETLLQSLKPEILVKGGDYAIDQVVGGEFVLAYGGKVQALEFLDNCSTSDIVEKMRRVSD